MPSAVVAVLDGVTQLYLDLGPEWTAAAGKDEAAHIGHAWFVRTHETAHGAILLHENDLVSEAAPLRRSMLEHALNIYWLADSPDNGYDAVIKAHQFRSAWFAANLPAGWRIEPDAFQQIADLKVPNSPEQNLLGFKALCERYGSPDLYEAWLAETSESHPSWLSGVPYMGSTPRDRGTLAVAIAIYLVMAAEAFSRLLKGDPWAAAVGPLLLELKETLQTG